MVGALLPLTALGSSPRDTLLLPGGSGTWGRFGVDQRGTVLCCWGQAWGQQGRPGHCGLKGVHVWGVPLPPQDQGVGGVSVNSLLSPSLPPMSAPVRRSPASPPGSPLLSFKSRVGQILRGGPHLGRNF